MKKIKINKLPEGFEVVDGKVVKKMQDGGASTGDQAGYSLVTYPTNVTGKQMSDTEDVDVRYSLSSVPRDMANIEAEGGETVLTDLNNDGNFGLYDIQGPRHSKGGVPMFLPEQSFIFSDTKAMKMKGDDLKEFGINSRKSMTPAKISKKFKLNEYYGAMEDEFADEIQVKSAETMLKKNKMNLSKLAFGQELNKQFEDGVPLASHPYLVSIGEDPIEFTARIENINKEKAMLKTLAALPPEKQAQILALQEFMAQAQAQQQMPQEGAMPPSADEQMMMAQQSVPGGPMSNGEMPMAQVGKETKSYSVLEPGTIEGLESLGIDLDQSGIGATKYQRVQPRTGDYEGTVYGDAPENIEGFFQSWRGIYPDDKLDQLEKVVKQKGASGEIKEVGEFQNWLNTVYIPKQAEILSKGDPSRKQQIQDLLIEDYGFTSDVPGRGLDEKYGTYTSSKRPLSMRPAEEPAPVVETEPEPIEAPVPGDVGEERMPPRADFWMQDLLKLNAINQRKRRLGLPYQPVVETQDIDYVLEDPTRAIAAVNEQTALANVANNMFSGPQRGSARSASMAGRSMGAIADTVAGVQNRNVATVNRGEYQQAMLDAQLAREQRDRNVKLYDDTELALQIYTDEKNFDREQYADALANAITNRANTFNLNTIQDYYQIDPMSGGMIGQVYSKAFDPVEQPDKMEQYFDVLDQFERRGYEPPADLLQMFMGESTLPNQTNIQAEAARLSKHPYLSYANPMMQVSPYGKKGKEIKKYATPFYTGKVGI
jgi:hypothetical protein